MLDVLGLNELGLPAELTSVFPARDVLEPERLVGRGCVLTDPTGTGFVSVVSISRVSAPISFSALATSSEIRPLLPPVAVGFNELGLPEEATTAGLALD